MVKRSLLFLIIALIATLLFFSGAGTSSIVPGWHTTILAPHTILFVLLIIWLYIVAAAYYVLEKKNRPLPAITFKIHLILTLSYFLISNGAFLAYTALDEMYVTLIPLAIFLIGQIFFIIQFARAHSSHKYL